MEPDFIGLQRFSMYFESSWNYRNFVISLNLGTAAYNPVTKLLPHGM